MDFILSIEKKKEKKGPLDQSKRKKGTIKPYLRSALFVAGINYFFGQAAKLVPCANLQLHEI